jgi:hypothetical protein
MALWYYLKRSYLDKIAYRLAGLILNRQARPIRRQIHADAQGVLAGQKVGP